MLLVAVIVVWTLPLDGQVIITTERGLGFPAPQIRLKPAAPTPGQEAKIWVTDAEPWAHVLLTVDNAPAQLEESYQNPDQSWTWIWRFTAPEKEGYPIIFYRDCHRGCNIRGQVEIGVRLAEDNVGLVPTKLGVIFPSPTRDWHNRQAWGVDLTYATLADEAPWGIDHLATRVRHHQEKGVLMLVRVDYAPGQTLPPAGDDVALAEFLAYTARLARDERLKDVHGYIIGSGYNAFTSNQRDIDRAVTPEWYARVFNGYGQRVTQKDNVVQIIRRENPQVDILVGPVRPWNSDQNGTQTYTLDAPWLNYFNTLVFYLEESRHVKTEAGLTRVGPDGFAIEAPGNPSAPELGQTAPAKEPGLDLQRATWDGAQTGFGIYRDWLAIINSYPATKNLPVYISSTNTFVRTDDITPAQNYPQGWLTAAQAEIQQTPQIKSLIWFMDDLGDDDQWAAFSLTQQSGRLADAAEEFDRLLQGDAHE
ncbi:MAG: hypothetical protein AAF485_23465 [Chloroflexota bacterium]